MKAVRVIALSILVLIQFSCKRDKECPAFNSSDMQHIAYNAFDTIKFINPQNDSLFIYLQDFQFSKSFKQDCDFADFVCPCINYVELTAKNSKDDIPYVFLKMEQSDASDVRYFEYQILDFDFKIDFDNEIAFADDFPYMELIDNLIINQKTYINVVIYTNTENQVSNVLKVFLNKENGILRIQTKENIIWDLIN